MLGAGDSYRAITTVLRALVQHAVPLPADLKAELTDCLSAYQHSVAAPHLDQLLRAVPPV
ncbi:hypothetical protein [Mycobacterium riyadhense]|uniref:hypothetical protein n=1 Tax=Mycobacterium riyadhense TaxID=486698 RepID=UPI00195B10A3|nr:hypothetical protein [Mycobacterium riyadhense]